LKSGISGDYPNSPIIYKAVFHNFLELFFRGRVKRSHKIVILVVDLFFLRQKLFCYILLFNRRNRARKKHYHPNYYKLLKEKKKLQQRQLFK